jgi:hypothetical protein
LRVVQSGDHGGITGSNSGSMLDGDNGDHYHVKCRSRWSHDISQSIPPWINEKIAGMLRVNRAYMNLVIQDDEGQTIYGHEVLKRIAQTGMTPEVNIVRGILPECFITYVSRRFPEVKEVRDLVASNEINYKLLEAVSDRIELGVADVVSMFRLQSKVQAGSDE